MGPRNQTQSVKNSLNAFSSEIASYIWARFTQKNSSQNLEKKKWKKLFNNYEAKLLGQVVKSLGKSITNMYSMGACSALGIRNQEALTKDLENDPFLNSALQRFTCELYYRFGSFLAPVSTGIITSRHYLSERNKNGERGMGDNRNGGDEKTAKQARSYWSCYNCSGVRFLV